MQLLPQPSPDSPLGSHNIFWCVGVGCAPRRGNQVPFGHYHIIFLGLVHIPPNEYEKGNLIPESL